MYDFDNFLKEPKDDKKITLKTLFKKPLTTKKKLIIASIAAIILLIIIFLIVFFVKRGNSNNSTLQNIESSYSGKANDSEYANTLSLINLYLSHGEFDRALDLIDSLLIKDANNKEALDLMNAVISLKSEYQQNPNSQNAQNNANNQSAYSDKLQEALSSLEKMNQESTQALNDIIKKQAEDEQNRKEQEAKEKADEAERQKKAAEEAAAKKAYEEELAQKSAALKKQMDSVQDSISIGKNQLSLGNIDTALEHFNKAKANMPTSEKVYSASKFNEIAAAIFDNYDTNPVLNNAEKTKLKNAAQDYSNNAINYDNSQSYSHYILGKIASENKDNQTAEKKFTDAVNTASDGDPNKYLYYFELGKIQYNAQRYTAACGSFTNATKLSPNFENAQYNLGMSYEKLNDTDKALTAYKKAVSIKPDYARAHLQIARLLNTKKLDYSGAITEYLNVLSFDSTNVAAMRELATIYSSQGNYSKSEDYFRKSLTYAPDDVQTMYNLSTVLYNQGKFQDALKYAKNAATTGAANATYFYNYALISESANDIDTAITYYNKAIEKDSKMTKAHINLGKIFLDNDLPENALSLLVKAVSLDSSSLEALNNLGSAYLALGEYDNAIANYNKAIKLDSKDTTAKLNLGKAYAKKTEYESAKQIFLDILKQDNKIYDAYIEIANVCTALGSLDEAEGYLLKLQSLDPNYRKTEVDTLIKSLH